MLVLSAATKHNIYILQKRWFNFPDFLKEIFKIGTSDRKSGSPFCDFTNSCRVDGKIAQQLQIETV